MSIQKFGLLGVYYAEVVDVGQARFVAIERCNITITRANGTQFVATDVQPGESFVAPWDDSMTVEAEAVE